MPSKTQIIPEHDYPHIMVVEHDNSQAPSDRDTGALQTYCNMMFVFASPKGIDRELQTIDPGKTAFLEAYGLGSFDDYGQPYLNALAAASTSAASLHCLRVTADDATFAGGALVAHYKATPKKTPIVPDPDMTSEYLDTLSHEGIAATDAVDETSGTVTITLAGTDIVPGISPENEPIFGAVSGKYIDVKLDLTKVTTLEPDADYRITQINPALQEYIGKDEFVSQDGTTFTKVKTYKGSVLTDGYVLLIGNDATVSVIIEKVNAPATEEPKDPLENNTDLGVAVFDDKATVKVAQSGNRYTIATLGEMQAGYLNPELWGVLDIPASEIDVTVGGLDAAAQYKIIQYNPVLSHYADDPRVSQEGTRWKKVSTFAGADLADGIGVLLTGSKADNITLAIYALDGFVDEDTSTPVAHITFGDGCTIVSERTPDPDPVPTYEELGTVLMKAAFTFDGGSTAAETLKANATMNRILRKATKAIAEDTEEEPGRMDVFFTFEPFDKPLVDVTELGNMTEVDSEPDENGYTAVKMFELASRSRGICGNNVRFVINSYARGDKLCAYKNYNFSLYEIDKATLYRKETFICGFRPDAVDADGNTLYLDYLVGDPYQNSKYLHIQTNPGAFAAMFAAYQTAVPDTALTLDTFDPLCGMVFGNSLAHIPNYFIDTSDETHVSLTGASGVALMGGSDGAFAVGAEGRQEAIERAYLQAWTGEIDRMIFSRKLFPTDIIMDANFPVETKNAISDLVHTRKDTMGIYDLGTEFNTFDGMLESAAELEPFATTRDESVEAYYGKIQDPATFKIVKVTGTYPLSSMYPLHFREVGAKHVALAGSSYGVITNYINKSAYPVFDEDIDQPYMDKMAELRLNYLKVNSLKQVVRGTQTTRQDAATNLSEVSNVFVLHDIRRDAIMLCEQYEFNFSEAGDLQRFNKAAGILEDKYAAAQVSSISAVFDINDWEAERGILHLYIEFVHKRIVKRAIVEIDINRGRVVV